MSLNTIGSVSQASQPAVLIGNDFRTIELESSKSELGGVVSSIFRTGLQHSPAGQSDATDITRRTTVSRFMPASIADVTALRNAVRAVAR
jgi:hypothetical protein